MGVMLPFKILTVRHTERNNPALVTKAVTIYVLSEVGISHLTKNNRIKSRNIKNHSLSMFDKLMSIHLPTS